VPLDLHACAGRPQTAGIEVGQTLAIEGMVGEHRGLLCFLNPKYELLRG
jgi:hypothetical protein